MSKVVVVVQVSYVSCQLESAWIITNIASGESRFTRMVVDAGGVPALIQLLSYKNTELIEQVCVRACVCVCV